jgi:hypothetical protein
VETVDALLVKFRWGDRSPVALLREALDGAGELHLFRAVDLDEGYAYLAGLTPGLVGADWHDLVRAALPGAAIARLTRLADMPGASAGLDAPCRYVVETDVASEHEADFNAWNEQEHLAGLASVPGTVRAARYRSIDGHPRYHACYDLERPETLGSPPWLAVRSTPWSDRVRPTFRNTKRTMFRRA